MFMQSFENSSKQLQRRQERQLALERMHEAANLVEEEKQKQQQQSSQPQQPIQHAQGNIDNVEEKEVGGYEDYPWNKPPLPTLFGDDQSTDAQYDTTLATVGGDSTTISPTTAYYSSDDDGDDDATHLNRDYNLTTTTHTHNTSSSMSVASASNFLKEYSATYSPSSPTNDDNYSFESSLSQAQHHNNHGITKVPRSHPWQTTTNTNNENKNIYIPSSASSVARISNTAKQFLWDDQSTVAGSVGGKSIFSRTSFHSRRSNALNKNGEKDMNLHDIKHGLHKQQQSTFSLFRNILPWNNKQDDGDIESQNLLNLSSKQRNRVNDESLEYGEMVEADSDDDSFMGGENNNNTGSQQDDDEANSSNKRVILDKFGNLSYHHDNQENEENVHKRRMRNSYIRTIKRPCQILIVLLVLGMIFVGASFIMTSFFTNDDSNNGELDVSLNDETKNGEGQQTTLESGTPTSDETLIIEPPPEESQEVIVAPTNNNVTATKKRFDHIRYTLISQKASPPQVFDDVNSPQYAALQWLTTDDERQLDVESVYLNQRYGLVVLWFSLVKSGYDWHSPSTSTSNVNIDVASLGGSVLTIPEDKEGAEGEGTSAKEDEEKNGIHTRRRRLQNQQQQDHNVWFRHTNWLSSKGICAWEGISCHPHSSNQEEDVHNPNNDGDISHVQLRHNNLHGLLPNELYTTLPYVVVVDLSDNGIAGTISHDMGVNWKDIEILNLTSNNIGGSLPKNIGGSINNNEEEEDKKKLSSLKELHISNNLLENTIPKSIGNLQNVKYLNLSGNSFKGTIPYEIGNLNNLSTLNLSWNLLVGELPHELSKLQNTLVELNVGHNNLGGPYIHELSTITYLERLLLNDNHFSGTLSGDVIGSMIHLDELDLSGNEFRGTLPSEISNLDGLDSLKIANNHFDGEFPEEWTTMASLQQLDMSNNQLKGRIPILIDGMKNLRSLNMAHNDFSSSIPSQLGSLYKLEHLYLDDNEFDAELPKELGELTNLKKLTLHNNYLVGSVDDKICKLADELFLTQLSADCGGEIPEIYCDCCICKDHEPMVHLDQP